MGYASRPILRTSGKSEVGMSTPVHPVATPVAITPTVLDAVMGPTLKTKAKASNALNTEQV